MARWTLMSERRNGTHSDDDLTLRLRCRVGEIVRLETALAEEMARFTADAESGERNGQHAIVEAARHELATRSVGRVTVQG